MNHWKRFSAYLYPVLLAIYFIHGVIAIQSNSIVSDETDHLDYGLRILKGKPEKEVFDDASTQPISFVNAIPRAVEQLLNPGLQKTDGGVSDTMNGRYITLLICVLIGVYIYKWSKELFGRDAGLFSLFLFTFCPNLQGNIPLVGTDAYAVLFTLTSAYYFRKFIVYSGWRDFILFSIHTGLALTVKHSLFLLPVFLSIISLVIVLNRNSFKVHFLLNLKRLGVFIFITLFIINLAFLFRGTGTTLNQYHFRSETFRSLQHLSVISSVPLPLPTPFVEGYDGVKYMLSIGSGHGQVSGRSYLFGEYFTGNSKWYYYSAVILFKTPLTILIMLFMVVLANGRKTFSRKYFFTTGYPLALAFFFIIFISLNNTSQHGLRHLLMVYPLFYICFGQLLNWQFRRRGFALIAVILYTLITFYSYFPNLLSYTNELIWRKKNAYKILASTNIDHGQGKFALERFLSSHTSFKTPGSEPTAGDFVVSINDYLDLNQENKHPWLNNFVPADHVNHCYLLFRITENDLKAKNLK